jgi:hypothetical protein
MDMEFVLGTFIILVWFAVVIWGAASLIVQAKRTSDWEKVGIAVLSAATVAGPLLTFIPEHIFFGIHTIGLGIALSFMSAFAIFALLAPSRWWK